MLPTVPIPKLSKLSKMSYLWSYRHMYKCYCHSYGSLLWRILFFNGVRRLSLELWSRTIDLFRIFLYLSLVVYALLHLLLARPFSWRLRDRVQLNSFIGPARLRGDKGVASQSSRARRLRPLEDWLRRGALLPVHPCVCSLIVWTRVFPQLYVFTTQKWRWITSSGHLPLHYHYK